MNHSAAHPIPIGQLWPGFLLGALLLLAVYVVQFDGGTISRTGLFLHELMHDGRHVLGVPCH